MSLDFLAHFSNSYAEAQRKFVAACEKAAAQRESFPNPQLSPEGGGMATEVAWFGPRDAKRVVVVISGTHGVEGFCGSGCQIGWVSSGGPSHLPGGVAVLLVHLINPFGAAWTQRETEESVNLNRNFLDFSKPLPKSPLHHEIYEALMCPDIQGPRYDAARSAIAEFCARHGETGYQKAIFGGQYDYPDGINFGGSEPVWANRTLAAILKKYLSAAREVISLDYHTGLGPYGHATLITFCPLDAQMFKRAASWFGATVIAVQGDKDAPIAGHVGGGVIAMLPHATVTPVTVEYGTYDVERECRVAVRDLWLRNFGKRESAVGADIISELREYFYPAAANWKEMVWHRSQQIMRNALDAFSS